MPTESPGYSGRGESLGDMRVKSIKSGGKLELILRGHFPGEASQHI
jgi:hypothetical protein